MTQTPTELLPSRLKGLTDQEYSELRLICTLKPWGRDRVSKAFGRYLDGDAKALDKLPTIKAMVDRTFGFDEGGARHQDRLDHVAWVEAGGPEAQAAEFITKTTAILAQEKDAK